MNLSPSKSRRQPKLPPSSPPMSLPDDLIIEVLSLLPVKSVMRLKTVCKSLNAIICNPKFIKLHQKISEQNKRILLISNDSSGSIYVGADSCLKNPLIPFADAAYCRLKKKDKIIAIGYCNGLFCLFGYSRNTMEDWLYFWNPATKTISQKFKYSTNDSDCIIFGFGYDNSTNTYKVVTFCQMTKVARVFCLGDNSWRNIQRFPEFCIFSSFCHSGVHLSGTLNWSVVGNDVTYDWEENCIVKNFVIISLDLLTETCTQLLPPQGQCLGEGLIVEPTICMFMDCLCLSYGNNEFSFVIWKMMEFGVQESWTQFLRFSYLNFPELFFGKNLVPLCLSHNGDELILADRLEGQLIPYNCRYHIVDPSRIAKGEWGIFVNNYVESLVSPNGM
ncbi:unnamed protein product [Vicia faba]|uniref:F-box domain-containing protein n=1 Tax=Vicia faba TaxID=3906 RepID=A0AAV0YAY6_VICFA|nr:unnamed protein product [Vicia faba]